MMWSRRVLSLALGIASPLVVASAFAQTTVPQKPAAKAPPSAAPATTAKKPAAALAKGAKPTAKAPSKPASPPRTVDVLARRGVAGGPTADDIALGVESPELRALHQAELELFPPALPPLGAPWPNELASPLSQSLARPRVHATGLPPSPPPSTPRVAEGGHDVSWLAHLEMPDLPVRWDARLVRYLEFFKDDPRGRQLFAYWLKRSGRYRDAIRRTLRRKALPEDLAWLPMVESGYDATARSPAGAGGLWQLTADTAHLYGLSTDRWADQRFHAGHETEAAVEMLSDLYRRFGSWELAMAAYNMGYGGAMSVVRRYNTNDYWALAHLEAALPYETTLYVPKVVAAAIVGRNLATFGFADVALDPAVEGDDVHVPPGTSLQAVATAAGCSLKEVEALNLELRGGRTPPLGKDEAPDATYAVKVPVGKGVLAQAALARSHESPLALERYVMKFGETLDQVAQARKTTPARIVELNAIAPGEVVRGGTVLLVPHASPLAVGAPDPAKPVVVVPQDLFVYPGRTRVFYRVLTGDTLPEIAKHLHVDVDDVRRWNDLDPAARLQDGMTLQAFVPDGADLSHVVTLREREARVLVAGTDEFFTYWEGTKGKRRVVVSAKAGETVEAIGKRYGVNLASLERINGRPRRDVLKEGETVVVYLPAPGASPKEPILSPALGPSAPNELLLTLPAPTPNGPLPPAPEASLLPPLP